MIFSKLSLIWHKVCDACCVTHKRIWAYELFVKSCDGKEEEKGKKS